jgi:hypothetical protein
MRAFRRFMGEPAEPDPERTTATSTPADSASAEDDERQYELELAREEARRLDELQQRQLRYSNYSWTPPAQGGERRADDDEGEAGES